jgi:hypothetical protein
MNDTIKRKLKKFQSGSYLGFSGIIVMVALTLFCITQLAINANLNPQGIRLEGLNREKNALIEENRMLEESIAEAKSITVISQIADKKLELVQHDQSQLVYISDTSIVASAQ